MPKYSWGWVISESLEFKGDLENVQWSIAFNISFA